MNTIYTSPFVANYSIHVYFIFFFFFQAEDGIRDIGVTGVQTCALPIFFVESRKLRYLGLFTFFCWAVIAVHPAVLPALGLCMLGFGLLQVALNLRQRSAWTGMVLLALAMWSVALGPVLLLFTGESPAAVLYSADINSTPPGVLDNTVFITESWRHIYEFDDGSYMMHPWLDRKSVV